MTEYQKRVAERPEKFTPDQVAYQPEAPDEKRCSGCWHWAQLPNQERTTCEIVAPEGEERLVPASATCAYWTPDGVTFPKQEKKAAKKAKPDDPKARRTVG